MHTRDSRITFIKCTQSHVKRLENNLKVFGGNKPKGPRHDNQYLLEMTWELLPLAFGLGQQISSHLQHLGSIILTVP